VPVGLLLSGGIDSGLLLGLMSLNGHSWPTYTVGYGKSFKDDELQDAKETARIYSAENVAVEISRDVFEKALSKIVYLLEEPIASSSMFNVFCMSARQSGRKGCAHRTGPDELFGGYTRHLGVHYGQYWRSLPKWVRQPVTQVISALPRNESLKRGVYALGAREKLNDTSAFFR